MQGSPINIWVLLECSGLNCVSFMSPKYVKSLNPGTCEHDLIWKRVFAGVIKVRCGHPGFSWAPDSLVSL